MSEQTPADSPEAARPAQETTPQSCGMQCAACGEELRWDGGDWIDAETHTVCASGKKHSPASNVVADELGRWRQCGFTLMKFFRGERLASEAEIANFLWKRVPELIRSLREQSAPVLPPALSRETLPDDRALLVDALRQANELCAAIRTSIWESGIRFEPGETRTLTSMVQVLVRKLHEAQDNRRGEAERADNAEATLRASTQLTRASLEQAVREALTPEVTYEARESRLRPHSRSCWQDPDRRARLLGQSARYGREFRGARMGARQ